MLTSTLVSSILKTRVGSAITSASSGFDKIWASVSFCHSLMSATVRTWRPRILNSIKC